MVVRAALLGLPSLFLSLARRNERNTAEAATHLKVLMDTFNIEDLVMQYATSMIDGIKVSAMLSLSQLVSLYTAASIVSLGKNQDEPNNEFQDASLCLRRQLNSKSNGICSSVLGLWSIAVSPVANATDAHFHPMLVLPAFPQNGSISRLFSRSAAPRVWKANLIYLQSVLAVVPESILRSSKTHEFFLDHRHFSIFDELVNETRGLVKDEESLSCRIPTPVWFFLMPFISRDASTRGQAAKMFGHTLLCNRCKVLSAFFVPESDVINQMANESETALRTTNRLFSEINVILRLCSLTQDALFFKETDFMPGSSAGLPQSSDVGISMRVFTSLCRWAPAETAVGSLIFERSLLSLIRIWIASEGGYAFDSESEDYSPTCHSSLASNAFDQLREVFKFISDSSHSSSLSKQVDSIMSKVFCEFFLPQQKIAASMRYRLLSFFIGTFLLPLSTADESRRAQNSFERSSAFEIMEFIDGVYPFVIVQMIKDEDHGKDAIL
jgi:hypothetical protein